MKVTRADEQLLLGLLNSTPVVAGVERDELEETDAWRVWLEEAETPAKGREVLSALRSVAQSVVRGQQPSTALAPFLADARYVPSMTADGVEWSLQSGSSPSTVVIRAVLAWDEINRTRPGRLRSCANPDCRRFLIDHSKANTARWCSMAICGNRMKARRHYQAKSNPGTDAD